MTDVSKKIALVTGASRGIGKSIATTLGKQGMTVIGTATTQKGAADIAHYLQDAKIEGTGMCLNVASMDSVTEVFARIGTEYGVPLVLVNNAGIAGPTGAIEELSVADIRRTLDVDLMGQFLVLRRAAPLLRASEAGVILNISSVAGRLGYALRTPYSAAKWGIVGLTQSLAKEMGPDGIRVNAILPGVVRGDRMESVIRERAAAAGLSYEDMERQYLANISLRRMVEPEDIAATALFLASPGGANISGQAISVCGNVETI